MRRRQNPRRVLNFGMTDREPRAAQRVCDAGKAQPHLRARPILVISSDDGLAPANDAFVEALHKAGNQQVNEIHMPTDHSFSDHRIELQQAILNFLKQN